MILIALVIELIGYNFHPILTGDSLDIAYDVTENLGDWRISYSNDANSATITLQEPVYVKKLYLNISCDQEQKYFLDVRYINTFGIETEEKMIDLCYPEFGVGVSEINRKVSSIRITYTFGDPVTVTGVRMVTKTNLNLYRIIFFILFQLFILVLRKGKQLFEKKPEAIASATILVIGCFIIFCQGINENGWDEQVHFKIAYNLSYDDSIQKTGVYDRMIARIPEQYYNTNEEKKMATQYLDKINKEIEEAPKEVVFSLNKVGYLIQSAALFLGRKLHLPFHMMFMFGKFSNLLTYVILMFFTIRIIPYKKWETAALALIPTQIFIASSYTYDVLVNGLIFLGFAMWIKVLVEDRGKKTIFYIIGSILAFGIGSFSKAVYIPLVLLCLFVPKEKFPSMKVYRAFWGAIIAVFAAAMCGFVIPILISTLNNAVGQFTDSRIAGSDQVLQMQVIFQHLPQYLKMLFGNLLCTTGELLTGHTALANFGRLGELDSRFYFITAAWFFMIMLGHRSGEAIILQKKLKMVLAIVSVVILILVATSMYLAATSVGAESISGIQGRYFYPLLLPLLYLLSNAKFSIHMTTEKYHKIILGMPVAILFAGIYFNMLSGWCF